MGKGPEGAGRSVSLDLGPGAGDAKVAGLDLTGENVGELTGEDNGSDVGNPIDIGFER